MLTLIKLASCKPLALFDAQRWMEYYWRVDHEAHKIEGLVLKVNQIHPNLASALALKRLQNLTHRKGCEQCVPLQQIRYPPATCAQKRGLLALGLELQPAKGQRKIRTACVHWQDSDLTPFILSVLPSELPRSQKLIPPFRHWRSL